MSFCSILPLGAFNIEVVMASEKKTRLALHDFGYRGKFELLVTKKK